MTDIQRPEPRRPRARGYHGGVAAEPEGMRLRGAGFRVCLDAASKAHKSVTA
ncbi:hypothetical protein [Nocardia sp. CA-119907]|uniref:hypothetical protein n=1 Tax=Nocardia sp. CA-119907 TaxID=3239973 RepID=UPI003D9818D7